MAKLGNDEIIPGFDDGRDSGISILLERVDVDPRCLKVHLAGRLDTYNTAFFLRSADMLIASGFIYVVFCCGNLGYVSSSGIGAFSKIHASLKDSEGEMFMVDLKPHVLEIFNILGYTNYFSFRETADDAVANLRHSAERRSTLASIFPLSFRCPSCAAKLKTAKSGKFLCSTCKARLVVGVDGKVRPWTAEDALGGAG